MAKPTRSFLRKVFICGFLLIATLGLGQARSAADSWQQTNDQHALVQGVAFERELVGGQIHSYQIALAAGEFLRVVITPQGTVVFPELFGPDKVRISDTIFSHAPRGPVTVSMIAEYSGTYVLEIRAREKDAPVGRYKVEVVEQRVIQGEWK